MTSRKPKLDLLYVDAMQPRLQLAVVTSESNPMQKHARHWQAARTDRVAAAASDRNQALRISGARTGRAVRSPQSPGG